MALACLHPVLFEGSGFNQNQLTSRNAEVLTCCFHREFIGAC
jgi:hypothetical protein